MTNTYLDRWIMEWSPIAGAPFMSIAGTGIMEWLGDRNGVTVAGVARRTSFSDSTTGWRSYRLHLNLERSIAAPYAVGLDLALGRVERGSARRSLLLLPYVTWTVSPRLRVALHTGLGRWRHAGSAEPGPIQGPPVPVPAPPPGGEPLEDSEASSVLVLLEGEAWTGERWRWRAETYFSRTALSPDEARYGGAGAAVEARRWWPGGVSVGLDAGVEEFGFRAADPGPGIPFADTPDPDGGGLLWKGSLGFARPLGSRAVLEARVGGLRHDREGEAAYDFYSSLGVRISFQKSFASPPTALWAREADGVRFEISYEGTGRLYLVGDFNHWEHPGVPLASAGGGRHSTILRLDPGTYAYKVRVIDGGTERWLTLPDGTPSVKDGFGGENGLLVLQP